MRCAAALRAMVRNFDLTDVRRASGEQSLASNIERKPVARIGLQVGVFITVEARSIVR